MASVFSQISPIEPVKILNAKEVSLRFPDLFDLTETIELEVPTTGVLPEGDLPILSDVESCELLQPGKISSPAVIPLTYFVVSPNSETKVSLFESLELIDLHSEDLYHLVQFQPAETFEASLDLVSQNQSIQISDNLLKPINPPKTVSGMIYADRYWKTETIFDNSKIKENKKNGGDRRPIAKDLHEVNGIKVPRPRFIPSFWDLIFVLLQPPLELGDKRSLLLPSPLYPYQIEGVRFLTSNEHALLADDMGTGKTVMTTVALKLLMRSNTIKRALILCPPSVLYEWKRHLADWAPELIACFVRGNQEIRALEWKTPAHLCVTTYDTLRSDVENELLPKDKWNSFDVVVIDEAHHVKNPATSRAKAIKKLKPRYRWALTGTPIQNKIEDMAALFDFIYPNYINQYDLYPEKIKQKVAPYFLRRRKQDVLKDLPPKIKQDVWLEMSKEQRVEYEQAENDIRSEIEGMGANITRQHIFAKMQRLKQICNFPTGMKTSPKLDALKEQIEDITESGNKVIIFSQYVDEGVKKIESSLKSYGISLIVGGQSDSIRKIEIDRFKNSEKTPILIASLKSGGEGLNLTEASYVVHFDHWWNPAVMWQAEDRVHRRGQKNNVNIYSYWMSDTIDDRIYQILKRKGLLIQNVVDGLSSENIEELITMDDLLEIMGVKKPEKSKPVFNPRLWQGMSIDQIHERLYDMSPRGFEELIEQLMHYLGYPNVKVTKRTGDGGIDVLSTRNTVNGVERIAAQCKKYRNPVGVPIAREFYGAIHDDKSIVKGYLVTTSEFTSECISYCMRNKIELIPGIKIADYVKQFGIEV